MNHTSGGTAGVSIGFEATGRAPFPQAQVLVPKYCELCGKSFLRPAIGTLRDCAECRARTAKHEAEMAIIPPPDGPEEDCRKVWQTRRERAAHALSLRETA